MHDHKREPRNNGYYMRREYNIDLLNEIFLLVNVTLFTGFLRSLPCCCTLIQKPFFYIMTKVEMAKDIHLHMWNFFAIYKCENLLPFEGENSIETNLQTSNLMAGQFISYKSVKQFFLNFQIKWQKARGWLLQNSHYQTVKTIRRKIFDWSATRTTHEEIAFSARLKI